MGKIGDSSSKPYMYMMDAMSPILKSGRVTSIIPFSFHIDPGKSKAFINFKYSLFSIIMLIAYITCLIYVIVTGWSLSIESSNFNQIYVYSEYSQLSIGAITLGCIILFRYAKRHKLAVYLENVLDVNKMLVNELGYERNYVTTKRNILFAVLIQQAQCLSCMAFITYMSPVITQTSDIPIFLIKYIPLYNLSLTQFICSLFIYVIWKDLHALNKEITKMYLKQDVLLDADQSFALSNDWTNKKDLSKNLTALEKLDLMWKIYAKICDSSFVLNEYISWTTYYILAGSFISILFETYKLMRIVFQIIKGEEIDEDLLSMTVVEFFLNFTNVVIVIKVCNQCEKCVCNFNIHF